MAFQLQTCNSKFPFPLLMRYTISLYCIFLHINYSNFCINFIILCPSQQRLFLIDSQEAYPFRLMSNYRLVICVPGCQSFPLLVCFNTNVNQKQRQRFFYKNIIFLFLNQNLFLLQYSFVQNNIILYLILPDLTGQFNKLTQFNLNYLNQEVNLNLQRMTSIQSANNITQHANTSPPTIVFPAIQISDATIKFNAYINRLINPQEKDDSKCKKIVRLIFQTFMKYQQSQQFVKLVYQTIKATIYNKRSYYLLYLFDLMLKNNKYFIKNAKKDIESMFKNIWEKVWTEYDNQEKIQNLRVMVKCWGWIYGQKVQENIRKWLEVKYNIKKIELNEQNEAQLKQVYGVHNEKPQRDQQKFNQLLMSSLEDQKQKQKDRKKPNSLSTLQKKKSNSLLQMLDIQ